MLTWPFRLCIILYRYTVSPLLGTSCRFVPSCSEYCNEALHHHGIVRGSWLGICRLLRCTPFGPSGWDPVPPSNIRKP